MVDKYYQGRIETTTGPGYVLKDGKFNITKKKKQTSQRSVISIIGSSVPKKHFVPREHSI